MRFRPLALFALTAGFAVVAGDVAAIDAKEKIKKNKKGEPPATPVEKVAPADPTKPAAKPLVSTVATPATKDAAALAKVIDAEISRKLAEAKITPSAAASDEEFLRRAY